jgi:hypothetical protein
MQRFALHFLHMRRQADTLLLSCASFVMPFAFLPGIFEGRKKERQRKKEIGNSSKALHAMVGQAKGRQGP